MQTPRNSAPVSSHKVHNLSREASGWIWGPGDHTQGCKQVLWVPKSLTEQILGTWARTQSVSESNEECEGRRLQLSPSHEPDVRWVMKPVSSSQNKAKDNSPTGAEKWNHQSTQ